MYTALYLSPMVPSFDLKETATFFVDLLTFKVERNETSYAILSKDNRTIHLLNAGNDIGQMEFYLEVDDVDFIWNSIKEKLSGIKHKAPFDREYGMREIHIAVPATNTLLFIGSEIRKRE